MSKTSKNGIEIEESADAPNDSTWQKPNPKGDWCNIFLLTLLYIIQGVPFGLSLALPIIIQSNYSVTYNDQGSFSFVLWPYSIKILWAPIVDSFYIRRIGQRKSWFIPVQYLIGALLLYFANNMDEWIPEPGKPNLTMIVCLFLVINFLNTTQDIAVDSWALTMLKKNNTSYAGSCNYAGINAGIFIGSVFPILLSSEKFCNRYLRFTPDSGGIFSIRDTIFFWSIIILSITTLVVIFKKEKNINLEGVKITIFQNYKLVWKIITRPGMGIFLIAVLTSSFGYATMDAISYLKLVDGGVSKDSIMVINTIMIVLRIILPIPASKYVVGPKPLSLILKFTLIRLLWNIPYALLIYYTPFLITNNGVVNVPVYYYLISGFIIGINELLNGIMILSYNAFFIKITDSRFAGTYLTLSNAIRTLAWITPTTVILKMFDILTFKKCSNDGHDCSTTDFQNICNTKQSHNCVTIVDGYYIEVAICIVIGFVWYSICKRIYKNVELKNPFHWIVDMNKPISVNI